MEMSMWYKGRAAINFHSYLSQQKSFYIIRGKKEETGMYQKK